jgi:hypothetical protein
MAARDALHRLVDDLPEEDVRTAQRLLAALVLTREDPVLQKLLTAPPDDEPDRDDDDGGLTQARREVQDGDLVSLDEVRRELELG